MKFFFEGAAQAVYLVSASDFRMQGLSVSPGWNDHFMFLGKTLDSHNAFLYLGVEMGTGKFTARR